jgi:pimeloyl-ACP methyl ester carboxylesterase
MRNAQSRLSAAAFFILIATLLGCASRKITFPAAPLDKKANSLVLKAGKFETASNKYKADFGTLVVPENRDKAGSRLIELPVIRIHASGSNPTEPIFYLEGGPGQSNTRFMPPDYLLSNHDFVQVGYRGADGSMVLDCPEVQKAVKGNDEVLSEKALKKVGEAFVSCFSRLKEVGVDLDSYTMMEVIEDLEAARVALGYKRIHLLSASYGTRLAYIYGLKHPDSIYRSAMIGVNPPGHFVWEPETLDAQLKYYADLWAKDPKMSARTPDLLATMRQVAHNMPRRWLFFPINPDKVKMVSFIIAIQPPWFSMPTLLLKRGMPAAWR